MIEKNFAIAPIIKNGRPGLLIRTSISTDEEIRKILNAILKDGHIEIRAIVAFRKPVFARARLRQLGLIS